MVLCEKEKKVKKDIVTWTVHLISASEKVKSNSNAKQNKCQLSGKTIQSRKEKVIT